ncbi:MAG TPA: twin-arginine translocase TatA/TatE family subunit [Oligoflexus sp.]|jgi:sec-independent protein translocase protein TatA|uniref:twin-arginine translocase TatA/TatE family subunit n=1 Tax=Oligoflexus sp. TaxID=1971216 RepID=UPI002D8073BB|nr:twin-arginine translocase TatA/TatE family subunit [Oligoflexus sp.]HET9235636.1 twin-arginine translocase TatA/TatE family subunit [Oligoflexus sp.]
MPIGTMEMFMIAGVVVLLFGTSKLPKLGQNLGEGIRNFKKSMADAEKDQAKLPESKS